jgi:tetratricopeptide (TPR) repeat protein
VAETVDATLDADLALRSTDCLEQGRSSFEALVHMFADADAIVVARAKRSAEGLDDLQQCRDEHRLRNLPPLPDDPAVRDEVRSLFEELSRTQVHEHTGRFDEGLALSRAALTRALATEHLPVTAVAHYRVALFLEKKGQYDEATKEWVASFHDAALGGHDQLAAEAATALAFCEGYQLARHDAGIRWAELAGVYLERLELGDTLMEATRLDVLAVLLEQKDAFADSIATHRRALEIRRANVGNDHHSVAYGLANLAGVLEANGEPEPARDMLLEAKRIFEATFGPSNPTTAHVLHNLANVQRKLGAYDEAEVLLLRVEAIWTETLGADHPDLGDLYNGLGDLRRAQARLEDAAAMHEKALAIHQRALAKDHPTIAHSAESLGEVLVALGRLDEAQAHFELAARSDPKP